MKPRIGVLIDHGMEMRHFVLSGLITKYRQNGYEVILLLTKEFDTPFFKEYIKTYDLSIQVISDELINYPASKWESRLRSLRDARKRIRKEPVYSHFSKKHKKNKRVELLARIPLLFRIIHQYGVWQINKHYGSGVPIEVVAGLRLQKILMLEYGSKIKILMGVGANRLGVKVDVYLNTLKTIYINDFLPFRPDKLFSWTKEHESMYYKSNWYHKAGYVKNSGSPFHTFLRSKNSSEISQICEKYGITEGTKFVLYAMIFEKVYNQEHLIIEKIYNYFQNEFTKGQRPQLAIRRNPFEEDDFGVQYLKERCPELIVCDHICERDADNNWVLQGLRGELEWRALLHRADLLLNIPSMSTIDAMMTQTKTGNIYFDEKEKYNSKVQHILESPFASWFSTNPNVQVLRDVTEIQGVLDKQFKELNSTIKVGDLSDYYI